MTSRVTWAAERPLLDLACCKVVDVVYSNLPPMPTEPMTDGFPCPVCARRFSRRYTLQEHMRTHTGEKTYECPAIGCGKRFSTTGNLARHRRRHGYIPPLECPVRGCECSFATAHKLARHMKTHRAAPVRNCRYPGCDKTFSTTGNLNRHMKNQHERLGHGRPPPPPPPIGAAETNEQWTIVDVGHELGGDVAIDREPQTLPIEPTTVDTDEFDCASLLDELAKFHAAQLDG